MNGKDQKQAPSFKKGALIEVEITDLAFGGKGIGKIDDYVVFVQNTIPGQKVLGKVIKKRKRFAECKLREVLESSPQEVPHGFQSIPGAPYATWPIEKQVAAKKDNTIELLKRIGEVENADDLLDEFIQAPTIWNYRNKMEYSFTPVTYNPETNEEYDAFSLGFKRRGQWLAVENINRESGLFDKQLEDNLHRIRILFEATGLGGYHPSRHYGFFKYLTVRKSFSDDQLLVRLTTSINGLEDFDSAPFVALMKDILGDRLAGVIHTIVHTTTENPSPEEMENHLLFGKDVIYQHLLGLDFEMSMDSFFQPNPATAELLYQKALDYVFEEEPEENSVYMDLFCGTGTIGQLMSKRKPSAQIIGVDIVAPAIENAKANAERNGLSGLEFYAADVNRFLFEFPQYKNQIHTIVLDPPRSGIAPKALRRTIELNANKIVYVSCNPATQARDIVALKEAGYTMKKFSMVDQFPHTSHIETVALFTK